ncbi:MAG: glycoside hydrolase family 6 protein [Pseudonocardiaceae bacterium]
MAARPKTTVYLDAGNPGWITDTAVVVEALRRAGGHEAAGLALNVANFNTTDATVTYGRGLGGSPGSALGYPPTTQTGLQGVDAFLWIKEPGDSDGSCRPGEPADPLQARHGCLSLSQGACRRRQASMSRL